MRDDANRENQASSPTSCLSLPRPNFHLPTVPCSCCTKPPELRLARVFKTLTLAHIYIYTTPCTISRATTREKEPCSASASREYIYCTSPTPRPPTGICRALVTTEDSNLETGFAPSLLPHSLGRLSQGHLHKTPEPYRNWTDPGFDWRRSVFFLLLEDQHSTDRSLTTAYPTNTPKWHTRLTPQHTPHTSHTTPHTTWVHVDGCNAVESCARRVVHV